MAVPNAGQLSLLEIAKERYFREYGYLVGLDTFPDLDSKFLGDIAQPISLRELTISSTVFPYSSIRDPNSDIIYPLINTQSLSRPNTTAPYGMSEFRNYDEDKIASLTSGYYEIFKRTGLFLCTSPDVYRGDLRIISFENSDFGVPVQEYRGWKRVDIPVDQYVGELIRPMAVFKQSVADQFENDVAVSGQWIFLDSDRSPITGSNGEYVRWESKPNYFYSDLGQWATSLSGDESLPSSPVSWQDIAFDEDLTLPSDRNNRWSIDAEDTASVRTGPEDDAIYSFSQEIWVTSEDDRGYADRIDSFGNRTKWFYYEASGNPTAPKYAWWRWKNYIEVPSNARYVTFAYNARSLSTSLWVDDYLQVFIDAFILAPPLTFL
jgi:hypothetical protein